MFDRKVFDAAFKKSLAAIAKAEKVTKETLRDMSRSILEATHATGDNGYMNKTLDVLSPVNRRVAVLFLTEFSGFKYDEEAKAFTGKAKAKQYDAALAKCNEALSDPHFNIWTWAEKNVKVEQKEFDLASVTKFVKGALKKAEDNGFTKAQVFGAMVEGGIDVDTLLSVLQSMSDLEVTFDSTEPVGQAGE